jgi:hypothetical protein
LVHSSLKLLNDRLPHVCERVARLFERDEDFRELCNEYEACARTEARFEADGQSSEALRAEYGVLLLRLERELLRYLEEHPQRDEA